MEMPKLEPDEPEKVEATDEPIKPMDLAPPMLTDVPQIVTDTSFVQKVQPPPPEGMRPAVGVLTIPGDRDTSQFRGAAVFDPSMLDDFLQELAVRTESRAVHLLVHDARTGMVCDLAALQQLVDDLVVEAEEVVEDNL